MIYICDEYEIKRPTVHKRQGDGKRSVYEIELTELNRRKVSKSNISYAKNITELNKEYKRIYKQGWNDAIEHIQRFLDRTSKTKNVSDYTTLKNKPQIVGISLKNTSEVKE